jgi:FixJ family two-component response regulator
MEQSLIAIVDDDESVRDATERLMRSAGFSAETFSRGADFLSSPDLSRTACLVTDLNMPGMSGFDLHRRLQSFGRSIPTILITGQPNENVRTQALSLGIICYLPKPFRDDDLIDSIHSALRSRQASGAAVSPPPLPPRWLSLIRRHETTISRSPS